MGLFSAPKNKHYEKWVEELPSLEGKVIAVTGTTSGTGKWFVKCGIQKNAKTMIMLNRESDRVSAAHAELETFKSEIGSKTELLDVPCDLQSIESVKHAATKVNEICSKRGGLNVLANNAGVMALPDVRTKDGYDVQMQTNHLSHFLLTKLLMPSFKKALSNGNEVRICQHSSMARFGPPLEEKFFKKCPPGELGGDGFGPNFNRYHMTKLANTVFAMKLHKELQNHKFDTKKIKSVVAEPGVSATSLISNSNFGFFANALVTLFTKLRSYQSAADGSLPLIEACFGSSVESGDFFYPEQGSVGIPFKGISKCTSTKENETKEKETFSEANQNLLWKISEAELETLLCETGEYKLHQIELRKHSALLFISLVQMANSSRLLADLGVDHLVVS